MPDERILHYRRARALPNGGGHTLFCVVTYNGTELTALGFPGPERFPDFDGEEAWFRVRWYRRGKFEVIRQVADKHGAPMPTPVEA